ncbi:twin-arginine translocase TatA/TatE family subunit [Candidatus Kaiserbacteria bacterium]|nr:twin-arginine translocase TatA/TatE family subunit [Candidatus Kaiserbacteria bacterium]
MNIIGGLGLPELIVIALILLLFFGSKRLPGLFRSIGTSIKELKDGLNNGSVSEADLNSPASTGENVTTTSKPE